MLGQPLSELGQLVHDDQLMLVHLQLSAGKTIAPHDHVGQDVYFTPIRGEVQVTLDENETHRLTPGTVLRFPGEATVGVRAIADSEFFVYLIYRR